MSQIKSILETVETWPYHRLAQFLNQLSQIADVLDERIYQDSKHGVQIRPAGHYLKILNEEVGELNKEDCQAFFSDLEFTANYRPELVQVAAVALAALFSFDTREAAATNARMTEARAEFNGELSPEEYLQLEKAGGLMGVPPHPYDAPHNKAAYVRQAIGMPAGYSMGWQSVPSQLPAGSFEAQGNPNHGPNNPHAKQPE